jgi:2-dehydro-3-deoxygluconokinase
MLQFIIINQRKMKTMMNAMKSGEQARYGLLVATSMGVRLTPPAGQPVHVARQFDMQATSAESNVASAVASLGIPVKVLTNFVKGSPISRFIRDDLISRHMDVEGPEVDPGGPWGYRHQFNLADSGIGTRGPRVHNDRAGEVGRILKTDDFDLERIFGEEGVRLMHLSGLVAALSPDTSRFCVELAKAAKRHGTLVSFDLNHRATFWEGREDELRQAFLKIAELSDILVGNEEDYQLCLGLEGPEAGGKDLQTKIEGFKDMIGRAKKAFPKTSVFATTLREVVSVNAHHWGAIMSQGDHWHVVEPREIGVLDRIGGGDGFVGGLLYGILRGWDPEKWIQFGWANGALTTTLLTDYSLPMDEDQVWSVWSGNARVKR